MSDVEPRRLRMLFFLDYFDPGNGGRFVNAPGLLPLIGSTRAAGFDVDFVTEEAALLRAIEAPEVDVVGISSMERLLPRSVVLARTIRRLRPDVVLMIGGNAIDPFARDLAGGLFDIVVLGEAEHALPALLRSVALVKGLSPGGSPPTPVRRIEGTARRQGPASAGGALPPDAVDVVLQASFQRHVPGHGAMELRVGNVYVRDSARGVVWFLEEPGPAARLAAEAGRLALDTGTAPVAQELDALCVLPWEVLSQEGWKHFEFYTQRGCRWGRCHFCSVSNRSIRALSPGKVVEVIAEAAGRGMETISFADDLFVQDPAWNREMLERLREQGLRVKFRAQTMANRSVWPLLELMQQVGFVELAFGLETLNPERAEFMAKSFNGKAYVENARETVCRTAAAGIYPMIYMIMVDPKSTLRQIASELEDVVRFAGDVYGRTGVVPKLSYSLMMLPVACTDVTSRFESHTTRVELDDGALVMPTEFRVSEPVRRYLLMIDRETAQLPSRRENLSSLDAYLRCAVLLAEEFQDPEQEAIQASVERGLEALRTLTGRLDADAEASVGSLIARARHEDLGALLADRRYDFRRFGGYFTGIQRFYTQLTAAMEGRAEEPGGRANG
ncbi:hypothetical protein KH5H1_13660 [Corallococcus caeni]|uniref:B12-binding domain-containing radical SAM protein n=1 Tax=Corallococcus caeni TaxID=3082388 RepID=UPI002956E9F3|nr:hypothetical protein KH5H1_13660 [Corallococcus sp. KH5-1]